MKKVYSNTQFAGHYPVGTAAIVVAESPEQAAQFLEDELKKHGLHEKVKVEDMKLVPLKVGFVDVLCDGNY